LKKAEELAPEHKETKQFLAYLKKNNLV
jgi:hypothetical protein